MDVYEDVYLAPSSYGFYFLINGKAYRCDSDGVREEKLFCTKGHLDDLVFAGIFRKRPANLEEEMLIDEVLK
ncbi:hypothetical protein AKO63_1434 [Escherichia coli]|uniref:hypothetical protein n=1 Tax=Escherichia coli TaxID=562 RepID=UPI000B8C5D08|nr:hypothetical protein [Escherichia coli]ASO87910.1 hypothetical protein AKO63_1434 [Escherichia coli]